MPSDRTNIGNARNLGLQKDLALTSKQYENCLAIYFVCVREWVLESMS